MKAKYLLLIVTLLLVTLGMQAQKLTVESVKAAPYDISASQYERKDLNGQACGLLKVRLAAAGAKFTGNVIGDTDNHEGEYWVYMTEGSYQLQIRHPNYIALDVNLHDLGLPKGIQPKQTYVLTVLLPNGSEQTSLDGNFLTLVVQPADAIVYLDGKMQRLNADGTLMQFVNFGRHDYRIEASGYEQQTGTVNVTSGEQQPVSISLTSQMSQLTIRCLTDGAELLVNNVVRGRTSWTGTLAAGTYLVKARKQGYHDAQQTVTLAEKQVRTVEIPALKAITGALKIAYQPVGAEIFLDGQRLGKSPGAFSDIAVGSHELEVRQSGYQTARQTVTVREGVATDVTGSLTSIASQSVVTGQSTANSPNTTVSGSTATNQQTTDASAIQTFTVNGVSFNMVRVDGGTFMMGATPEQDSDALDNEKPAHQVTLSTYSIGETEVTQALWQAVMGSNSSNYKGDNLPVEKVSWDDCQTFINKLNQLTGKKFRLPTEAEWEYAARGGNKSHGYKYSGSNSIDDVVWYASNSGRKTHAVKTKQANELGLYDMSGNVEEWCQDRFGSYSSGSQSNPTGPSSGSNRVLRGGSWFNYSRYCRVSNRICYTPSIRYGYLGLRLAL